MTDARPTIGALQAELDATHANALTPVNMDSVTRSFNNCILESCFGKHMLTFPQATGQCVCKDGVRGQKCESCVTGFWNLGFDGCEPCACNADYAVGGGCIQETGQCTCLPYVEGINCDGCPENHILIQNEVRSGSELPAWKEPFDHVDGCFPCESCIEDLMSSMKKIRTDLDPIMEDFKSKEASFYAHTRLNYLNNQIERLIPEIKLLNPVEGNSRIQPLEEATARITGLSKSLNLEYKLERLKEWAEMAQVLETDGSNAVNDMGMVGVEVNRVIHDVENIVGVLAQGMNAELQETSLRNAEAHLEAMQQVDFTDTRRQAEEEQNEARIMMEKVNEMSRPVEEFKKMLEATEQRLADLDGKISDISERTKTAEQLYKEADWINRKNKDSPASRNIQKIKDKTEATKASQDLSESLVEEAEGFLQEAKDSYSELDVKRVPMDFHQVNFDNRVQTYKDELDNLFPLERDVAEKAHELTVTANDIEEISRQAQAPAQAAINAATVFKNIIALVTEAKTAAEAAAADSEKAAGMSDGVANKASKELARINAVYSGGAMDAGAAVKVELGPKLATNKRQVERLTQQTTDIKEDLESINNQLDGMDDLTETIEETKKLAGDSLKDGEDALASIKARASDISMKKTVAHEVRNNNTEFNVAKTNIKKALNEYESKPNREKRETTGNDITDRLNRLNAQKTLIESLANRNSDLVVNIKDHIEEARRLLGRMNKPAVTFSTGSNLELNNPDNLEDLATKTDVSFYVKGVGATNDTTEANDRAFMFYLGNLEGTSKKLPKVVSDDFMAIEVMKSAFVQLTMDLGSGPVTITSTKPLKANDWSQVMVKREGRNVELIVRTENGPGEIESDIVTTSFPLLDPEGQPYLSGSVFNLHQEYSKIYVGGFPTGSGVQNSVRSTDMTGQIEGLKIGGKDVGLWNYKAASLIQPSVETRNKFIPRKTSELRFDGNGYMKLKPEDYSLENEQDNIIEFEFRTTHPEGLMFLTGSPDIGYLAIQLRDSRIVFSFKLGSTGNVVEIQSDPVELDTWVHVHAER